MKKGIIVHIVIFENYQEGYAYQENLLSQKHKELGYDVRIIASQFYRDNNYVTHKREAKDYVNEFGIPVYVLESTRHNAHIARFYNKCIGLYNRLNDISPDIIFLHNFSGKDIRAVIKYKKIHPDLKLFVDCHSDYYNDPVKTLFQKINAWQKRYYAQKLLPYVERFWGTLPWRVQYLQEVYNVPADKTGLLIMGADENIITKHNIKEIRHRIRKEYGVPENAFLIASGGKLDRRKQQDKLMEAVNQLYDKCVWLIIFGEPTEEMKPFFAHYNSSHNIIQTGWMPPEFAYDAFMASDLAFFPGTHSVLWEQAAACGTPIVARHWSGIEHICVNGNAILLEDISIDSIKETIIKLNHTYDYDQMKANSLIVAHKFYLKDIAKMAISEN